MIGNETDNTDSAVIQKRISTTVTDEHRKQPSGIDKTAQDHNEQRTREVA